jgi:hypothetical protein
VQEQLLDGELVEQSERLLDVDDDPGVAEGVLG